VLELPGLAGRVGDQAANTEFAAQVMHPAGEQTGLDDDDGGAFLLDESAHLGTAGVDGGEADLARGRVVDAGDALVFAEVDAENGVVRDGGRGG
jgi:hypothetical protein